MSSLVGSTTGFKVLASLLLPSSGVRWCGEGSVFRCVVISGIVEFWGNIFVMWFVLGLSWGVD